MYRLWQILLAILWRRRPAMAVEASLVGIIQKGLAIFEDEDSRFDLQHNQATRARISGALLDAHRKVDLLIHLRALARMTVGACRSTPADLRLTLSRTQPEPPQPPCD